MGLLNDFLQSASNTAADTVAGPIDLIAWGLRKAGLPVPENAVGSTKWMTEKGLRRDVQQSPASLAGETLGLISPIVAAAKAPQIAAGVIRAGENLAAPRTLNPQAGAIVWHGSPHKFDKFDSSKIGTGEGAQAYGHGLYLAESPNVAGSYAKGVSGADGATNVAYKAMSAGSDPIETLKMVYPGMPRAWYEGAVTQAKQINGHLYKVDLPDPVIAQMLDWDAPLSKQAPGVVDAIGRSGLKFGSDAKSKMTLDELKNLWGPMADQLPEMRLTGQRLYTNFGGTKDIAEKLRDAGIPGIRYLDGGSRGAGAGTSNFVVFPGNEGLLTILERNGQGLLAP